MSHALVGMLAVAFIHLSGVAVGWLWAQGQCAERAAALQVQATTDGAARRLAGVEAAASAVHAQAQAGLQRAAATGATRERQRQAIDHHFATLEQKAADETHPTATEPTGVDSAACVLPAERLRLWQAANAGPWRGGDAAGDQDDAGRRPAEATAAPAATPLGGGAPPGGEPPPGGAGLSPDGEPAVRPAELAAGPD